MPWIQYEVSEEDYKEIAYYAEAKSRSPGNLSEHATRRFMRQYKLRQSEIHEMEDRLKRQQKD